MHESENSHKTRLNYEIDCNLIAKIIETNKISSYFMLGKK